MVTAKELRLLLEISDGDSDELLEALIRAAERYAADYCGLDSYDSALDTAVLRMAAEDYGKVGSEGASYKYYSGFGETYRGTYSDQVKEQLRCHRKIRSV
jgi:hypothetical protein